MAAWSVAYHSLDTGGEMRSHDSPTRDLAIDAACNLMRQGHTVRRVVGPGSESVELPEIECRYRELLAAGRLV
jgi:hypothetical protein